MTAVPSGDDLLVFADLQIVADGHPASLVADGHTLTFTSDAPNELLASLPKSSLGRRQGIRAAGRAADLLGTQGLTLRVVGPRGEIARLGSGAHSWWGRMVVGSAEFQVGSIGVVASLATSVVRQSRLFWPVIALVAAGVGATAIRARRR